jgi:K+ transporter
METVSFHDEMSLADAAVQFGEQAIRLKLVPSFVVRHFPDSRQFYIPDENTSEPLTPEQAYLQFKQMLSNANRLF